MSTWDLFQTKYKQALPEVRAFVDSEEIPKFVSDYLAKNALVKIRAQEMISALADHTLEVISNVALSETLGIDNALSTKILSDLQVKKNRFILKFKQGETPVPDANIGAKEKLELRPEARGTIPVGQGMNVPNVSGAPVIGAGQSKPLTREELMSALGAKRTMASDMARAQGGGAPVVPPPAYGKLPVSPSAPTPPSSPTSHIPPPPSSPASSPVPPPPSTLRPPLTPPPPPRQ